MAAIMTFKEQYVITGVLDSSSFEEAGARLLRYELLWAAYENTAYRDIHKWAQAYRNKYGLYKYIRNIYNPAYRLGEFWKGAIWGGLLDQEAGAQGAIPIVAGKGVNEDQLRAALANLWKLSNWNVNKDICTLRGAVLGDTALRIVDDVQKEEARLELVHPSAIADATVDARGFIKAYRIEELRTLEKKTYTYTETAERGEGDEVVYKTFRDNQPFAWPGQVDSNGQERAEWSEPYGFIPLIIIQHNNVGLDWGWSESHPLRSKMNEIDDLASKLHDHIRKMVDPVWLFNFNKPKTNPEITTSAATTDRPAPGREELPAMYVNQPDAKGQALVAADLDIEKVSIEIRHILEEIERDYPELQMDIWSASGETSGKALDKARERVEKKAIQRRPNYDDGLVRAQQMALAIGGFRKYKGFEGFDLESFDAGQLDHAIGPRPVFETSQTELLEEKKLLWETVKAAVAAGASPEAALADLGWTEEKIQKIYTGIPQQ
jgi:hypothetical protein